ncbi:MAG: RNA polymerase sigma factor (sigma-70 family) [Ancylomarina sp.]|jgi:RNA polymerase sigma factor (sigma-70 family)
MKTIEIKNQIIILEKHLKNYAYQLTMNKDDAQDLYQDTVLKAITFGEKFTHNNLKAWALTIMKNIHINGYRRKLMQREWMSHELTSNRGILNVSHNNPLSTQNYKDILEQLNRLDLSIGVPLRMFLDGFKYREIADEMNLPIGTIKSRIFMGRKILMAKLGDFSS